MNTKHALTLEVLPRYLKAGIIGKIANQQKSISYSITGINV